jgi:hypothetical protein
LVLFDAKARAEESTTIGPPLHPGELCVLALKGKGPRTENARSSLLCVSVSLCEKRNLLRLRVLCDSARGSKTRPCRISTRAASSRRAAVPAEDVTKTLPRQDAESLIVARFKRRGGVRSFRRQGAKIAKTQRGRGRRRVQTIGPPLHPGELCVLALKGKGRRAENARSSLLCVSVHLGEKRNLQRLRVLCDSTRGSKTRPRRAGCITLHPRRRNVIFPCAEPACAPGGPWDCPTPGAGR